MKFKLYLNHLGMEILVKPTSKPEIITKNESFGAKFQVNADELHIFMESNLEVSIQKNVIIHTNGAILGGVTLA